MRLTRLLAVFAAGVLAMAAASADVLAQAAPQGKAPAVKPQPRGLQVTLPVKVKSLKAAGGYYLQGPVEVYRIANKNPDVLEPLLQSGATVTVEAIASGDLLTIQTINGEKYEGKPLPPAK